MNKKENFPLFIMNNKPALWIFNWIFIPFFNCRLRCSSYNCWQACQIWKKLKFVYEEHINFNYIIFAVKISLLIKLKCTIFPQPTHASTESEQFMRLGIISSLRPCRAHSGYSTQAVSFQWVDMKLDVKTLKTKCDIKILLLYMWKSSEGLNFIAHDIFGSEAWAY